MNNKQTSPLPLISGKIHEPQRVVIYGPEGIGKTTYAAAFPDPVFLDTEGGTRHLEVTRLPQPQDWEQVTGYIRQLSQAEHSFRTLVIDTVDWLERLCTESICRKNNKASIEDFGYGKGYTYLSEEFSRFLFSLELLRRRGMHIVLVAHSTIRKFEQPDASGAYDRFELKLSRQTAPLVKEWADLLLFANYFTKVTETDGRKRAVGGKERRIHTEHCAAFDAKNRAKLPEILPMSFDAIASLFPLSPQPAAAPPRNQEPGKGGLCTPQQIINLENLWKQLSPGPAERTKLFNWLGADAVPGAEAWQSLTEAQAAKAIGFLSKKLGS